MKKKLAFALAAMLLLMSACAYAYIPDTDTAGNAVLLVDNGDSIQGEPLGTITKGGADIEPMNLPGYDVVIPGNHEFDYGMDRFMIYVDEPVHLRFPAR